MKIKSFVPLLPLWILFAIVGYLLIFPINIITFDKPGVMEIGLTSLYPGDTMPLRYPFTKYVDLVPEIHTRLINLDDKSGVPLVIRYGTVRQGYHPSWWHTCEIPENTKPGRYMLERTMIFQINFLRKYTVVLKSPEFRVVPDGPTLKQIKEKLVILEKHMSNNPPDNPAKKGGKS